MLVPRGKDDVGPVGTEHVGGGCVSDIGRGVMLLEGNRGVVVQKQLTEGGMAEQNIQGGIHSVTGNGQRWVGVTDVCQEIYQKGGGRVNGWRSGGL